MWRAGAILPGDPRRRGRRGFLRVFRSSSVLMASPPRSARPRSRTSGIPTRGPCRRSRSRCPAGLSSGPPGSTGCMAGPSFWWSFIPPPPAAVAHAQGYVRDSTSFPPNRSLTISTSSTRIAALRCSRLPPACPTAWAGKSHWVVLAAGCCAAPTHRQSGYCPGPETVNSSRLDSALPYPVQTTPGSLRLR